MKKIILTLTILALATGLKAQSEFGLAMEKVKPLDSLIAKALQNAPSIERIHMGQLQRKEEIAMTKKGWMQHIALTAGYNYGTGVISDYLATSNDRQTTFATRQNATYNVGVNLRLPFTAVSHRKHQIKMSELAIKEMEYQKEDLVKGIREEVIRRYSDLSLALTGLKLQAKKMEANNTSLKIAETYFKAGKMEVEQYRMAVDIATSSEMEYEKMKSDAWFYLRSLEEIVGAKVLK